MSEVGWMMVETLVTIAMISLLWKDNPFMRFVENLTVGGIMAHTLMYAIQALQTVAFDPIMAGRILLIVPLLLGILQLGRVTPAKWVARYPTAILVGIGVGIMVAATIEGQVIAQIKDIAGSMITARDSFEFISFLLSGIGTITGFTYFLFTREHTGALGISARIGRIVLMAGFGVGWGAEVGWFLTAIAARFDVMWQMIQAIAGM